MKNEIKEMFNKIIILEKENETYKQAYENMKKNNQQLKLYLKIEQQKIDKAIEYIEKNYFITGRIAEIYSILQGKSDE